MASWLKLKLLALLISKCLLSCSIKNTTIRTKGHCHEHNFKNSTAQKHVYTIGNLLAVVKFS